MNWAILIGLLLLVSCVPCPPEKVCDNCTPCEVCPTEEVGKINYTFSRDYICSDECKQALVDKDCSWQEHDYNYTWKRNKTGNYSWTTCSCILTGCKL